MFDSFRGWKHKAGAVLAAAAVTSFLWWMRSIFSIGDEIQLLTISGRVQVLTSADGELLWSSWTDYPARWYPRWRSWYYHLPSVNLSGIDQDRILARSPAGNETYCDWRTPSVRLPRGPFRFKKAVILVEFQRSDDDPILPPNGVRYVGTGFIFPYWSVVVLLSSAAAWLLLSKRHDPKPTQLAT